ncbi:MAG: Flp pilus assembly complex ATPase component TadA [Candidatus Marsarchaeota archaeon]|jgi:flagellar protein FlaI|nr:Flp pilus assembly complex ATPase component TadA [Candidatus Marsarchaeota archaeon]
MDEQSFFELEFEIFNSLAGKLGGLSEQDVNKKIELASKTKNPALSKEDIDRITNDAKLFEPVDKYINEEDIEDIMINSTKNIFVYKSGVGQLKTPEHVNDRRELDMLVAKIRMYVSEGKPERSIVDVHLPNGSRVNVVDSPIGANITIRNFRRTALSIIDLINMGEMSYNMAGRFWLYAEGLKVRPANLIIGGMPASGKTTLLNAMFSFFRPEQRIVVIEDTYELNTDTQENCVRLETTSDTTMQDLVKNSLRMRPDMIIIGEVRGAEAKDMMTAMNIGKISMGTIHASTSRDVVTRLQHTPMSVEKDIIPLIDSIIVVSQVNENNKSVRKITQVSEIAGIETQVLLSDLYMYDYKTHKSSEILPSVTYRDTLSKLTGVPPTEIVAEEQRRGRILQKLNELGVRDLKGINEMCRDYYDNPDRVLQRLKIS